MPTTLKRILVTGGAGFIGSHVVERLVSNGHTVTVVDDLSRGHRSWLPVEASFLELDIRDEQGMAEAMREVRPEVLVHLAALHFIPAVDDAPELAQSINVHGMQCVLAGASAQPPKRILFASTGAVYGDSDRPCRETDPVDPIDLYGRTKVEGEKLLRKAATSLGASAVAARLFNVIGPRETNRHVVPEIIEQLRAGADSIELGNLEPRRDFVDVRDAAAAFVELATAPLEGFNVFNVGTGRAVSVLDLLRECERIVGRSIAVVQTPKRMRTVERMTLVSDPSALRQAVSWNPRHRLADTLRELLGA